MEALRCSKKLWQSFFLTALPVGRWRVAGEVRLAEHWSTSCMAQMFCHPKPIQACRGIFGLRPIGKQMVSDGADIPQLFRPRDPDAYLEADEPSTDEEYYANVAVGIPEAGAPTGRNPDAGSDDDDYDDEDSDCGYNHDEHEGYQGDCDDDSMGSTDEDAMFYQSMIGGW